MKRTLLLLAVCCFVGCQAMAHKGHKGMNIRAGQPVRLIIETDMGNDVDDALALNLAYKAIRDGLVDLRMVSVHKQSDTAPQYIDLLNRWAGYQEVTVSRAADRVSYGDGKDFTVDVVRSGRYPGSGKYADGFPDAVQEYRRILMGSPNNSVVIVSLGFATTLARLLDSKPDAVSYYDGRTLVER